MKYSSCKDNVGEWWALLHGRLHATQNIHLSYKMLCIFTNNGAQVAF